MGYIGHNDYEILYLLKEGNQEAMHLMFEKYKGLISKKIFKFNLQYEFDDMYQESLMVLLKTIRHFDMKHAKSFTRYFEMNLERKFMTIVSKRRRRQEIFKENELYIFEKNHSTTISSQYYELYAKEIEKILTNEEYLVYTLREIKNYSVKYISSELERTDKQIYNIIHRAKTKIRTHFDN